MFCKICNKEIEIDNANFVKLHLKKVHNISSVEYYNTFLKQYDNEGICKHCNAQTKFKSLSDGYNTYCSRKCCSQSEESKKKSKETMLIKYGVTHISKTDDFKKQACNTLIKYKDKINKGIKKAIYENKDNIINKRKNTNLCIYGTEYPIQNESVKNTMINTNITRYGVNYTLASNIIKDKIKNTNIKKYGNEYHTCNKDIINKIQKTKRSQYWDILVNKLSNKRIIPNMTLNEFIDGKLDFKCNECSYEFTTDSSNAYSIYCPKCIKHKSTYEYELHDYLSSIGISNIHPNKKFSENGKRKYEIDLYIPELNIGIEYCGLYWHSMWFKDSLYHQNKYKYFNNIGIRLIQIYESEWLHKKDIVKSILNNMFNIKSNVIYARKCIIRELSTNEYTQFLNNNHLQGYTSTLYKYGLIYNNDIVAICGIGKNRYSTEIEYELIRYCTKLNTNIIGGFSKLVKNILNKYNISSILSYSDLRYFNAHAYEKFGFIFNGITKPNYYYFKNNSSYLESRIKYQKHKLQNILNIYDPSKSEFDNMLDNKYFRIYDAGNSRWILHI